MLNKLDPKHYLTGAIVLGFFQIVDGMLALNGYRSSITTTFSIIELLWFLVSLIFVLAFQKQRLSPVVPQLYIFYYAFSWLYGSFLLTQKVNAEPIQLPTWFMLLATVFGTIYCLSAYFFYKKRFLTP